MAYSYTEAYRAFRGQQAQLLELIQKANGELSAINMPQQAESLALLEKKVRSESFKIQVTGTFKNGKSTFINAFLGEEILPAYALPCTAVINEVRYGKEKKAVLYFRDPLPDQLPAEIPGPVMAHMKKYDMKKIPPVVIPYDQIDKYVVIPMGKDPSQMLLESPYDKVVLYWPLPLLSQGVQIIDSPGLNEHATRTRVTMDHLSKADAILFVLSAQALCSKEEMDFLENTLSAQGFHDPLFVVNRFDCIPERERPAIMRFARQKLEKYTSYGSRGIFFLSALQALEAKRARDGAKLKASGMAQFEMQLSEFLIRNKGRVKLAQPAYQMTRILEREALERSIPMQRRLLGTALSDVKQRYDEAKPRIELLRKQKDHLRQRMDAQIRTTRPELYQIAFDHIQNLGDMIEKWLDVYTPVTKFGAIPSKLKAQSAVKEFTDHLSQRIETYQQCWVKGKLLKSMDEVSAQIFDAAQADIQAMLGKLDSINDDLAGSHASSDGAPMEIKGAAISSVFDGQLDSAERVGIQSMTKTVVLEVGAGLLLTILSIFNPFMLGTLILAPLLMKSKKAHNNTMDSIKKEIGRITCDQIRSQANSFADKVADNAIAALQAKAEELIDQLEKSILGSEEQMRLIIAEMEQGQSHVKERELALQKAEKRIVALLQEVEQWNARVMELTQ